MNLWIYSFFFALALVNVLAKSNSSHIHNTFSNPISQAVSDYFKVVCSSNHPDYRSGESAIVCNLTDQDLELVNLIQVVKGWYYYEDQKCIISIFKIIAEELFKIGCSEDFGKNPDKNQSKSIRSLASLTMFSFLNMRNYEVVFRLYEMYKLQDEFNIFNRSSTSSKFIYLSRFHPHLVTKYAASCCSEPSAYTSLFCAPIFYDSTGLVRGNVTWPTNQSESAKCVSNLLNHFGHSLDKYSEQPPIRKALRSLNIKLYKDILKEAKEGGKHVVSDELKSTLETFKMANELRFGSSPDRHAAILRKMPCLSGNQTEILVKAAIFSGNSELVSKVFKLSKRWVIDDNPFFTGINKVNLYLKCLDEVLNGRSDLFWRVIFDSSSVPPKNNDILLKVLETFESRDSNDNFIPSLGWWNLSKADKNLAMIKLLWTGSLLRENSPFLLTKNLKTLQKLLLTSFRQLHLSNSNSSNSDSDSSDSDTDSDTQFSIYIRSLPVLNVILNSNIIFPSDGSIKFFLYGAARTAVLSDDCVYNKLKDKMKIFRSWVYSMLKECGNEKQLNRALDWAVGMSEKKTTAETILFEFFDKMVADFGYNPHYHGSFGAGEIIALDRKFILDIMSRKYPDNFKSKLNKYVYGPWIKRASKQNMSEL